MSDVSVDIIKNRSGEAPDLPSGANLSGVSTAVDLQVTNLNPTHINASGVTTATTFSGSLKSTGTPTLGLGVTINSSGVAISGVATAGIVSATTLYGNGENLTGVAMSIAPISYNPDVNDSTVPKASGIGITFTERVIAGSGNVTLRIAGAAGTVVENFGVGSSVTINNNTVSIDPTSDLTGGDTYYISYPSGAFTNTAGDVSYVGTAYTFGVKPTFTSLWSWGQQGEGALGLNDTIIRSSPVQIPGDNWQTLGISGGGTLATKTDGTIWSWGINNSGMLGLNNRTNYSSPVQIPGTTWSQAFQGNEHAGALRTDGTLWLWGINETGQLGQNSRQYLSSPTQVPGTWATYAGGAQSALGSKTDGTLWAWGWNSDGKLGLNAPTVPRISSPTQIPGTTWGTTAGKLSWGNDFHAAIKTDGTLWTVGSSGNGGLGQNNMVKYSSPVQIYGGGTTWSKVTLNSYSSAATKTDGTLWVWGDNEQGMLGLNQAGPTRLSSPTQIPGTTWNNVICYYQGFRASKTDGTLWAWGSNSYGQLGQNNKTNYSSPVQVPGTTWNMDDIIARRVSRGFAFKVE